MTEDKQEFKSTKQVLELIGLTQDEIEAYFHLTGRGPVMAGEIALLINVPEESAITIAKRGNSSPIRRNSYRKLEKEIWR